MTGVALVTGGARRIGAAIVRALAADGWRVVVHCHRSMAEAEALAHETGAAGVLAADLGDQAAIEGLIGRAVAGFGPLGLLVNNASAFSNDGIADVTWESLTGHMIPNLAAPVLLSRDFARQFARRTEGEAEAEGNIINLLDQKVNHLNPDFLSYTLSKVALAALTRTLAMALAPSVRVNGVSPGLTLISGKQTPASFQRAWHAPPLGRSSTPEELAEAVRFVLRSPSMTGQNIVLDGGESLQGRPRDVAFDPALGARPGQ